MWDLHVGDQGVTATTEESTEHWVRHSPQTLQKKKKNSPQKESFRRHPTGAAYKGVQRNDKATGRRAGQGGILIFGKGYASLLIDENKWLSQSSCWSWVLTSERGQYPVMEPFSLSSYNYIPRNLPVLKTGLSRWTKMPETKAPVSNKRW